MSLIVLLYLSEVLNYGIGTLPVGEPCEIRDSNPYEWHAFAWDGQHRLTRVEWYTSETLRKRSLFGWSGAKLERIEVDESAPFDGPDFLFTITWSGDYPVKMVRDNAPHAHVTGGRIVWTWLWSQDHRSVRISEQWGAGPPTTRTASFDAAGRLLTVSAAGKEDRFLAELKWSTAGRLVDQRTYYDSYTFTYDDRGRIATRATPMGAESYRYECR
jgi:YD repeat-containing protein